jgi:hypothetical protein
MQNILLLFPHSIPTPQEVQTITEKTIVYDSD